MSEGRGNGTSEAAEPNVAAEVAEAVAAVDDRREDAVAGDDGHRPPLQAETEAPASFDESAEAAFLAEARERGEKVPVRNARDTEASSDNQPLPSLDELVQRIPATTRELLDDLFRVRFTTVRRVPAKALKE